MFHRSLKKSVSPNISLSVRYFKGFLCFFGYHFFFIAFKEFLCKVLQVKDVIVLQRRREKCRSRPQKIWKTIQGNSPCLPRGVCLFVFASFTEEK